jgi:hypothetical protein
MMATALGAVSCARTTATPLSRDVIQISSSAAPICGSSGAQALAAKSAAIETISRGYDGFVVLDAASASSVGVVGYTPVTSQGTYNTMGTYGSGSYNANTTGYTTYSGGSPIVAGSHDRGLIIKMFKTSDPAYASAVDARSQLGPAWQEIVAAGPKSTCM